MTDAVLESLAPHLKHLEHFHIAGCPKITHRGVWAIISANATGIVGLGLEGVSQTFVCTTSVCNLDEQILTIYSCQDMIEFGEQCRRHDALAHLRSVTLTLPIHGVTNEWLTAVEFLLWASPLELFQLYTSGGQTHLSQPLDPQFVRNLCARHGERLLRFAVLRLRISMDILGVICTCCINLEQLFVAVEKSDLVRDSPQLFHYLLAKSA